MGTRGFVGFVADGVEKIAYNHWDSYPSGLGADTLAWLRFAAQDVENLRQLVRALRVIDEDSPPPTEDDLKRLAEFADLNVSTRDPREWYVLLRETQGNPANMLLAGVIEDASDFPADSLFAEWGYVVDLDAETFEVYQGFQTAAHNNGRFSGRKTRVHSEYHPVALVRSWPLSELPSDADFDQLEGDGDE